MRAEIAAARAIAQAHWALTFTDSCVIKEEAGRTFDTSTGKSTPNYNTIYTGSCLIRPLQQEDVDFGQQLTIIGMYLVVVPLTVTGAIAGMLIDVTSASDPFLTDKQFTIKDVKGDTFVNARKLLCEEAENG